MILRYRTSNEDASRIYNFQILDRSLIPDDRDMYAYSACILHVDT